MLTEECLLSYLIGRNLLSPEHVVERGFRVTSSAKRHRNFRITDALGRGWFAKQGCGGEGYGTVAHEAAIYGALSGVSASDGFSNYLPDFIDYNANEDVLVIELFDEAAALYESHAFETVPRGVDAAFGQAIGMLHCSRPSDFPSSTAVKSLQTPSVFWLGAPPVSILREMSRIGLQVLSTLQERSEVAEPLSALGQSWRDDALIHFDAKLSNVLAFPKEPYDLATRVKIIDLEYVGYGDRRWDVGSVFAGYLDLWLASMPLTGRAPADQFMSDAKFPLSRAQDCIRDFWTSYRETVEAVDRGDEDFLIGCVQFAAARLIHTALERAMVATALDNRIAALVQLGANMLQEPHQAVRELLGLEGH